MRKHASLTGREISQYWLFSLSKSRKMKCLRAPGLAATRWDMAALVRRQRRQPVVFGDQHRNGGKSGRDHDARARSRQRPPKARPASRCRDIDDRPPKPEFRSACGGNKIDSKPADWRPPGGSAYAATSRTRRACYRNARFCSGFAVWVELHDMLQPCLAADAVQRRNSRRKRRAVIHSSTCEI